MGHGVDGKQDIGTDPVRVVELCFGMQISQELFKHNNTLLSDAAAMKKRKQRSNGLTKFCSIYSLVTKHHHIISFDLCKESSSNVQAFGGTNLGLPIEN